MTRVFPSLFYSSLQNQVVVNVSDRAELMKKLDKVEAQVVRLYVVYTSYQLASVPGSLAPECEH